MDDFQTSELLLAFILTHTAQRGAWWEAAGVFFSKNTDSSGRLYTRPSGYGNALDPI